MKDQNIDGKTGGETAAVSEAAQQTLAQRVTAPMSAASRQINSAVHGLAELVKLEVVVSVICCFVPFLLIIGDGGTIRQHISGYYDMGKAQYFYFPLTVAAMLFVVNGLVKEKHWYNVALGSALAIVVLFNHFDHKVIHNIAAGTFFIGNALVFIVFTPRKELWFKIALAILMLVGLAGHFVFNWYTLFWAETVSLWIIAAHFVLEALGLIE